jgi:hypothetical protein
VKAVSVKPSLQGRAAAHHANSELVVLDEKTGQYLDGERVTEYALGKVGEIVPPDACRKLPANSFVKWDVHYYPVGKELKDDVIEMGFWLYPEGHQAKYKQDLKLYTLLMKGGELELPPHATAMTQGSHSFKTPTLSRPRFGSTASSRTATSAWSRRRSRSSIRIRASWRW